ncbi:MAG: hypothetical protein R3Y29_07385 [bacterium]
MNYKKLLFLTTIMSGSILLTACSDNSSTSAKKSSVTLSTSVSDILESQVGQSTLSSQSTSLYTKELTPEELENQKDYSALEDVRADVDFTLLSQVVVFSQMNNMYYMYEDYLGQTVKIKGHYYADFIPDINMTYHYILLMDEANCCQGIMEFRLPEGVAYPEAGEELMILGYYTLDIDETGEYPYVNAYQYVI